MPRRPSRVMMLMVPAMACAPVSAVGARYISIRSTISGVSDSIENPGGTRWPSNKICVYPALKPRIRTPPPRPGLPPKVMPGMRFKTSPILESPCFSISSRPITILLAVDSRRCCVSLSRPLVISTLPMSATGAV